MKTPTLSAVALLVVFTAIASVAHAGVLSYRPIVSQQSDAGSAIDSSTRYTAAVDTGLANGSGRNINGINFASSPGGGDTIDAGNIEISASSGQLVLRPSSIDTIKADGVLREVLSDAIYNDGASQGSTVDVVLDPQTLEANTTYDLRLYFCNGGGSSKDRDVSLTFFGDGQPPVETGSFNADDARTSPGKFEDRDQVYFVNYRFTWDGKTIPGVRVTQNRGSQAFALYALTNQQVADTMAAQPAAAMNTGLVTSEEAKADQIGVTSETFYNNEALNNNGRWIEVKQYGRCWQPNDVPDDWRPYTRGGFQHSQCGWTWVSDESEAEWGWATFHYGRWLQLHGVGCGWAWVPGTVWGPAWVSWRSGNVPECTCVGWAPLPPQVVCQPEIGVSTWVERKADIGPGAYTFVEARRFGERNYHDCGCIIERKRYVDIVRHTANITNISYTRTNASAGINVYNGGPDVEWCDREIRRYGGAGVAQISISRVATFDAFRSSRGYRHFEGNTLAIFAPHVQISVSKKNFPKIAVFVPATKVTHGWDIGLDKKKREMLRKEIVAQTKGVPDDAPATFHPRAWKGFKGNTAFGTPPPKAPPAPPAPPPVVNPVGGNNTASTDSTPGAPPAPSAPPPVLKYNPGDPLANGGPQGSTGATGDGYTNFNAPAPTPPPAPPNGTNATTIDMDNGGNGWDTDKLHAKLQVAQDDAARARAKANQSPNDPQLKQLADQADQRALTAQTALKNAYAIQSANTGTAPTGSASNMQNALANQGYQLPTDPALRQQMVDAMNGKNPGLAQKFSQFQNDHPGQLPTDPALVEYAKMNAAGTGQAWESWMLTQKPDGTQTAFGKFLSAPTPGTGNSNAQAGVNNTNTPPVSKNTSTAAPLTTNKPELKSTAQSLPGLADTSAGPSGTIGTAASVDDKGVAREVDNKGNVVKQYQVDASASPTGTIGTAVSTNQPNETPQIGTAISVDKKGKINEVQPGASVPPGSNPTGTIGTAVSTNQPNGGTFNRPGKKSHFGKPGQQIAGDTDDTTSFKQGGKKNRLRPGESITMKKNKSAIEQSPSFVSPQATIPPLAGSGKGKANRKQLTGPTGPTDSTATGETGGDTNLKINKKGKVTGLNATGEGVAESAKVTNLKHGRKRSGLSGQEQTQSAAASDSSTGQQNQSDGPSKKSKRKYQSTEPQTQRSSDTSSSTEGAGAHFGKKKHGSRSQSAGNSQSSSNPSEGQSTTSSGGGHKNRQGAMQSQKSTQESESQSSQNGDSSGSGKHQKKNQLPPP